LSRGSTPPPFARTSSSNSSRRSGSPPELDALVWAGWLLASEERPEENPFCLAVLDVTLRELAAADAELMKLATKKEKSDKTEGGSRKWWKEFSDLLRRHPLLEREMSSKTFEEIDLALDAIVEGEIEFRFLAWAMLAGLRFL